MHCKVNLLILFESNKLINKCINDKAGYAMGACLATQLAKSFINFEAHNSTEVPNEQINLSHPYWLASIASFSIAFLFLIAQYFELRISRIYEINRKQYMLLMEDSEEAESKTGDDNQSNQTELTKFNKTFQQMFFSDRIYEGIALFYMLLQIFLFFLLFLFTQAFFTILSRFMLTYLTKGPAQFSLKSFATIDTTFWVFVILGRFMATYLSIKINSVIFYLSLLTLNAAVSLLFLIPSLTSYKIFYWMTIPMLGALSGPLMPSGLMIAKQILEFNSFVLSLFIVGLAVIYKQYFCYLTFLI